MTEKTSDETVQPFQLPPDYLDGEWAVRQCFLYKEEYDDCTSFKARFHQYFIHGESLDCQQWKTDYNNCRLFRESKDRDAGKAVIESEGVRRQNRLKAHYANDVWKKRSSPPDDWNQALPDWLQKKNENTYLELKANELKAGTSLAKEERSFCSIM